MLFEVGQRRHEQLAEIQKEQMRSQGTQYGEGRGWWMQKK